MEPSGSQPTLAQPPAQQPETSVAVVWQSIEDADVELVWLVVVDALEEQPQ